jgi:hypothetical protein
LLVAEKYEALSAAASIYRELTPHVLYPIAGRMTLIEPPTISGPVLAPVASPSRVPMELLNEIAQLNGLSPALLRSIDRLVKAYARALKAGKCDDNSEERILVDFAKEILITMGLRPEGIQATKFIRTIEADELAGGRDHFFHSFQNYFLGLAAIAQLKNEFLSFKDLAKVNWDVEPADVWFLTAIWHDVGYAAQKFNKIADAAFGAFYEELNDDRPAEDERERDIKDEGIQRLLARDSAHTAIRAMASLMARLLKPQLATTQWMIPGPKAQLGRLADQIVKAINENTLASHGALGAIRLYCDYTDTLDKMEPNKQLLLRQTVLLACCSMPFHDQWFRENMRTHCRHCRLPVGALPFAALLAFVDSIQDDRRNLKAVREALLILERLLITSPGTIEAQISVGALSGQQLLDKIIEGRDVLAALDQRSHNLKFKYPDWVGA